MHDIVSFEVDKFEDTDVGQIEFSVILKKPAEKKLIGTEIYMRKFYSNNTR